MALSRMKFTKEVGVPALKRLDAGALIAEVARAFEVNPNLLHRWRKEFRHGPGNAFPGTGKRRWDETKVRASDLILSKQDRKDQDHIYGTHWRLSYLKRFRKSVCACRRE